MTLQQINELAQVGGMSLLIILLGMIKIPHIEINFWGWLGRMFGRAINGEVLDKVNDLSKKLGLDFKVIQDAVKYWEDNQVITKKNTGYIINNLQEIELHKLYKPVVALSAETLKQTAQNKRRANAIETINNKFFQGIMSPSWYSDIDLWFKKYNFDEEVMVALFQYCFSRSALHRNYIQTVADAWFKSNVKTFNDVDAYFAKQEKLNVLYKSISKKLGYTRQLTDYEKGYIQRWSLDYSFPFDIIEIALKKTTSKSNQC